MNHYAIIRVAECQGVHRVLISPLCWDKKQHLQFPIGRDLYEQLNSSLKQDITPEIAISHQHAQSLSELVKWFKLIIKKRAESNAPLTLEYCDELLEALEPERSPNERSRS